MSSRILSDTVVERTPKAAVPEQRVPATKWNDALSRKISESFQQAQRGLSGSRVESINESQLLSHADPRTAVSIYRRATLIDKLKISRIFRLPHVSTDPVYDHMSDPAIIERQRNGSSAPSGIMYDLMSEDELWNARGACLSVVRVYMFDEWDIRVGVRGAPALNSLLDERMGPVRTVEAGTKNKVLCPTCAGLINVDQYVNEKQGESNLCPGHFGHIQLPGAVWNPMMETITINVLRAFCWHCGSLPGTDAQNERIVGEMFRTCETRAEKIAYLAGAYRDMKCCNNCAALKNPSRRCRECRRDKEQCGACANFLYFRPQLRTVQQSKNTKEKVLNNHMKSTAADDEAANEALRHVARSETSGFPCDAVLAGNASVAQAAQYEAFATEAYGRDRDRPALIMHGERVRQIIAQMSDDFLKLFFDTSLDQCEEVRSWFNALVPRIIPVIPNCARPTIIGNNETARIDDMTRRYKDVIKMCNIISKKLDPHKRDADAVGFYTAQWMGDIYSSPRDAWFKYCDADTLNCREAYADLQYYYATVISDKRALRFRSSTSLAHGVGRAAAARNAQPTRRTAEGEDKPIVLTSYEKRLHGKGGRVRWNLEGKRVERSMRTVITPDPTLSIREVRVPMHGAARLIVSETLNSLNAADILIRAERSRTMDTAQKPHGDCRGCARCEEIAFGDQTELCIYNADGTERVYITGPHALKTPVYDHPFLEEEGCVVERTLKTGDYVVMNRQPSLHGHSTQAHRVVLCRYTKTFGLSTLITEPYNADFDGDEMNMYCVSGLAAAVEMLKLMAVAAQSVSTSNSQPVRSLKQDAATGVYLLTSLDAFLDKRVMCTIMLEMNHTFYGDSETIRPLPDASRRYTGDWNCPERKMQRDATLPEPAIRYKKDGRWHELWTGLQVASLMLPQSAGGITYKKPFGFEPNSRSINYPAEGLTNNTKLPVYIHQSEFMFGRVNKSIAKAIDLAIMMRSTVELDQAQNEACMWIDRCGYAGRTWLDVSGFSVGIADCVVPTKTARQITKTALSVETEVQKMLDNDFELMRGKQMDRVSAIEMKIKAIVKKGTAAVWKAVSAAVKPSNGFSVMFVGGGKGNETNLGQIAGVVGGQEIEGRRAIDEYIGVRTGGGADIGLFNHLLIETTSGGKQTTPSVQTLGMMASTRALDHLGKRLMPHRPRGIYPGAAAGGNVANSFLTGLTPEEFWNHAKAGREGIIDTAVKTSITGDAQRLASKSAEGICVRTDGTVRSETDQIVAFRYGGTSYHPVTLMCKKLPFISMTDTALQRALFYEPNDWAVRGHNIADADAVARESVKLRSVLVGLRQRSKANGSDADIFTPNNLRQIIIDVIVAAKSDASGAMWHALDDVRVQWLQISRPETCDDRVITPAETIELVETYIQRWAGGAQPICDRETEAEVRLILASKQVTRRLRLRARVLRRVLDVFERVLYQAIAPAGEAVGMQMVQSIGQPATQMTLNTFHHTGQANVGVISGVPRQNELSLAIKTHKMKGAKVVLPLREQLLISSGQRALAAKIVGRLVAHTSPSTTLLNSLYFKEVAEKMRAPMRTIASEHFASVCQTLTSKIAHESARLPSVTRLTRRVQHSNLVASVLADVDCFFVDEIADGAIEDDTAIVAPVRTLHSMTQRWRTIDTKNNKALRQFGYADTFARAHKTLVTTIRPAQRRFTTVAMLCESIWRAVLPIFGADAPFAVVPRIEALDIESTNDDDDDDDDDEVAGGQCTVRQRRADAEIFEIVTDIAIVAFDCSDEYEQMMYEHVRQNRHAIFVDLLEPSDAGSVQQFSNIALRENNYAAPQLYIADVAGTDTRKEREHAMMTAKKQAIMVAQTRHFYKNVVSTRVLDIVMLLSLAYEPLTYNAETDDVTVAFQKPEIEGASEPYFVALCEQEMCQMHFGSFHSLASDARCQRAECMEVRYMPAHERHDETMLGCLSNWVLSFHLDPEWFMRNQVETRVVGESVQAALGTYFAVIIGDGNSHPYVPMRVHVYRCQVDKAIAMFNDENIAKVNDMNEDDPCAAALNRAKWAILNLAFSGPLSGSVVMCDTQQEQLFTSEKGLERVERAILTTNCTDLYHLMGLRGIDARRVRTNSPHDALNVIGVEAARMTLIDEYREVIEAGGQFVNAAHLELRADIQTRNGNYLPLSASGLRAAPHDVFQSASHRETAMMFVQGALHRRNFTTASSPSTAVALSRPLTHIGTGGVMLMLDTAAFMRPDTTVCQQLPLSKAVLLHRNAEREREEAEKNAVETHAVVARYQKAAERAARPIWLTTPMTPMHNLSDSAPPSPFDDDTTTNRFSPSREESPPPVAQRSTHRNDFDELFCSICLDADDDEPFVSADVDDVDNMPHSPLHHNNLDDDTPKSSPNDTPSSSARALADISGLQPTPFDEEALHSRNNAIFQRAKEQIRCASAVGGYVPEYNPESSAVLAGVSTVQLSALADTVSRYTQGEYDPAAEVVLSSVRATYRPLAPPYSPTAVASTDLAAGSDEFDMSFNPHNTTVSLID